MEDFEDIVYEILKIVIADGKGIEVNTANVRYHLKNTTPCKGILKMYKELGGEILTIGSDSHAPGQLGFNIAQSQEMLKDLGFEYFCTFEKMKPIFHRL